MMAHYIFILLAIFVVSHGLQKADSVTDCLDLDCMHICTGRMLTVEHHMTKFKKDTEDHSSSITQLQMQNEKLNQTLEHVFFELMRLKHINGGLNTTLKELNVTITDTNAKMYVLEKERKELKNLTGELNKTVAEVSATLDLIQKEKEELKGTVQVQQDQILQLRTEIQRLKGESEEFNRTAVLDQHTLMETFKNNITWLEKRVSTQDKEILNWASKMSLVQQAHLMSFNWTNTAQAFAVKLSSSGEPINVSANNTQIIFGDVILNVNDAYNTSSGHVRASITGRYFFSLTVRAFEGKGTGSAHASIEKNDQIVAFAISSSKFDLVYWPSSGSVSIILDLIKGDIVYVSHPPRDEVFQGQTTAFSGCLLYQL